MNLYLRLLWTLLRVRFLKQMGREEVLERQFRVLPNDLDINGHMNNGRYLTLIDLMIVEYFARIGFLKVLMKNGWRPMSGGAVITYRKDLKPFQKYTLRYFHAASDEYWNFMRFEFLKMDGTLSAAGYVKGAAVSKKGLVQTETCFRKLGVEMPNDPLPKAVEHWLASEKALFAENRSE